jgi:hypothetical protein
MDAFRSLWQRPGDAGPGKGLARAKALISLKR